MSATSLTFDLYARDYASSKFSALGGSVQRTEGHVAALRSTLGTLAKAFIGLYAIQKVTMFLEDSVAQGRESNKVSAQTQAVLKSTGHAAGITAGQIGSLADKISLKAGIDDEAIQSGENLLLTFRNIHDEAGKGNDIFTQATKVTTDLSVAMGKDMKSSSILVGKALNDPIKGLASLSRVGVQFSQTQTDNIKKMVESGHTMRAQKTILGELNKEFGGSAKAQADPADRAKVAWENLKEEVGKKLIPTLDKLLVWFVSDALPAIEKFGGWIKDNLFPIIKQVGDAFSGAGDSGGKLSDFFHTVVDDAKKVYDALKPVAVDIFEAVKKDWPQIQSTIESVMDAIQSIIDSTITIVVALWKMFGDTIVTFISDSLKAALQIIKGTFEVIQGIFDVIAGILTGDWSRVWDGIKEILHGAVNIIVGMVKQMWSKIKLALGLLGDLLHAIFSKAWDKAKSAVVAGITNVVEWVTKLPGKITHAIGNLGRLLFNAGAKVIQGLMDGMDSMMGALGSKLFDVTQFIVDHKGPPSHDATLLEPAGKAIMGGLIKGIQSRIQDLKSSLQGVTDTILGAFTDPFAESNTTLDVFTNSKAALAQATMFRNDLRKLQALGMSPAAIAGLVNSGNFALIHDLADDSRREIKRINRLTAQTTQMQGQAARLAGQAAFGGQLSEAERQRDRVKSAQENAKALQQSGGIPVRLIGHGNHNASNLARGAA